MNEYLVAVDGEIKWACVFRRRPRKQARAEMIGLDKGVTQVPLERCAKHSVRLERKNVDRPRGVLIEGGGPDFIMSKGVVVATR